ncbi:DbpA RNA binding domain-containing protein [Treponema sp. OMZ 840]|uniref:DbpA RNA binding domain-containing protein n=1 Tax=Treponema sp. OMZ 840 TaxID=244313 RepID=UPI003D8C7C68
MAFQSDVSIIKERFETILARAVTEVKTEEDPLVLNEYKKLFKKNVPLSLRSYVAAYIIKQLASGFSFQSAAAKAKTASSGRSTRFDKNSKDRSRREKSRSNGTAGPEEKENKRDNGNSVRIVISPESAATIFINIGRNRGVFPRDLIALICQRVSIERERIGEIRVLDNYSFVQVYAEDTEKIIESLNGSEYRNRKLTVSHSRKKEEANHAGTETPDYNSAENSNFENTETLSAEHSVKQD